MDHQFNVGVAKDLGIESAILLQNLMYWIRHNKANNTNFYDGRFWTYNSTKAFKKLFPYMSESKIVRTLKKLEESGIIMRGNYNKMKMDRTIWYSFTDSGFEYMLEKGCSDDAESICQNGGMQPSKVTNATEQNGRPIPDNKPNIKTEDEVPSLSLPFSSLKFKETWETLRAMPKWKRKTQSALQMSLNKLSRYEEEFAVTLMENAIAGEYQGVVFQDTDRRYQEWQRSRSSGSKPDSDYPESNMAYMKRMLDEFEEEWAREDANEQGGIDEQ